MTRLTFTKQEGWLAENAADEQNGAMEGQAPAANGSVADPMQGLEGLDVAGPKLV